MSESASISEPRTPWHLWLVGVLALVWNAGGAMNYVMTQTRNADYMSGFSDQQLAFFYSLPAWAVTAWAIGVWGGVLGSVLLLLRRRLATWVLLASFAGVIATTFRNYVLADGLDVAGDTFSLVFTGVIFLVALGLYLYARAMQRQSILS